MDSSNTPQSANQDSTKYNILDTEEQRVILNKGTEPAFTGIYNKHYEQGTYLCKQCDQPLFKSLDKFNSGSGWPAFDDAIEGAVKEIPDEDGRRTEIVCSNCEGHLGHVFFNEGFTEKNTRHCVNSVSLKFEDSFDETQLDTAIFASGCFWGTEFFLKHTKGVVNTEVGYTGGHVKNPSYREVCTGTTGHAEAVRVVFDTTRTNFEAIAKMFFETHDPTQIDRQGPDIGEQYRTEVFYLNEEQKKIAEDLIAQLTAKGLDIATKVTSASEFYIAEEKHQDYYDRTGGSPYCHSYTKRFD